ncbi:MAG: hypothetical protein AAF559_07630 [Pseudomonadota bacterium]
MQQSRRAAVAGLTLFVGQLTKLYTQTDLIVSAATIRLALVVGINDWATLSLTHGLACLEISDSIPFVGRRQYYFARRPVNAALSSIASASIRFSVAFLL